MEKHKIPWPIFEALLPDKGGISAIAFVEKPATETHFLAFSEVETLPKMLPDQQLVVGPLLIPDQPILRIDAEGNPYFLQFRKESIAEIALQFMQTGNTTLTNDNHQVPLSGNFLAETWIVENPNCDKAKALGFDSLPAGTWMAAYKVADPEYWNTHIATGARKGFSIEGAFNLVALAEASEKQGFLQSLKRWLGLDNHNAKPLDKKTLESGNPIDSDAPSSENGSEKAEEVVLPPPVIEILKTFENSSKLVEEKLAALETQLAQVHNRVDKLAKSPAETSVQQTSGSEKTKPDLAETVISRYHYLKNLNQSF